MLRDVFTRVRNDGVASSINGFVVWIGRMSFHGVQAESFQSYTLKIIGFSDFQPLDGAQVLPAIINRHDSGSLAASSPDTALTSTGFKGAFKSRLLASRIDEGELVCAHVWSIVAKRVSS